MLNKRRMEGLVCPTFLLPCHLLFFMHIYPTSLGLPTSKMRLGEGTPSPSFTLRDIPQGTNKVLCITLSMSVGLAPVRWTKGLGARAVTLQHPVLLEESLHFVGSKLSRVDLWGCNDSGSLLSGHHSTRLPLSRPSCGYGCCHGAFLRRGGWP
jgi:hypothetical protein